MASYIELLRDPRWQRKRLEILSRDNWACKTCGDKTRTLNVHHRRYKRGRQPWEYDGEDLVTLCEVCHEDVTGVMKLLGRQTGQLDRIELRFALGFAFGLQLSRYLNAESIPGFDAEIQEAMETDQEVFVDDAYEDTLS